MPYNKTEALVRDLYDEGLTYPVIAERLGKSLSTIKNVLVAIRKRNPDFVRRYKAKAEGWTRKLKREPDDTPPDVDGDIEEGKRCPTCWLLYPADCVPGVCMARSGSGLVRLIERISVAV